jgi:hypothetical protein
MCALSLSPSPCVAYVCVCRYIGMAESARVAQAARAAVVCLHHLSLSLCVACLCMHMYVCVYIHTYTCIDI